MNGQKEDKKIVVDLKGKSLGRSASFVANALRSKDKADFAPNKAPSVLVEVKNVGMLKISEKKAGQKKYRHYTGYPGGLRETRLSELYSKAPREVFNHAVKGMLPKNKLQKKFLKNLRYID